MKLKESWISMDQTELELNLLETANQNTHESSVSSVTDYKMSQPSNLLYPAVPSRIYNTYWRFAFERQEMFFRKFRGTRGPVTSDPILQDHRITNPYKPTDALNQLLENEDAKKTEYEQEGQN